MRFLSLFLLACAAMPQTGTEGSILGIVKDSSGAAVPKASVAITNVETGLAINLTADDAGFFQAFALPRGSYSVVVTMAHFTAWRLSNVELVAGEQKRISPVLSVGDVKQEITVQAGSELLQTERASVETAIEQKQIRDLPLNGRDPIQMVSLTPGMRYLGVSGNTLNHQVQGLGQHNDATQFSVDGMTSNDPSAEGGIVFPNLDAVAQFRVQTSSFSAENGRQPLQVQMITKSGANEIHGTVWEFLRNDALDARNTFARSKPTLRRNQYGFSAGGPIVKNKTFVFTSFEGLKIRTQSIFNQNTIPNSFLDGDFGAVRVTDPLTNNPFANNQIPASRFSNASKFFFPYIPVANAPGNLFQALAGTPENGTNFIVRGDQLLTSRQKLYLRWIRVADSQNTVGYRPSVISTQDAMQHNLALNYDWTLTPSILFNLSGGFIHTNTGITSPLVGQENLNEKAGIQGFPTALRAEAIGLPSVAFTGYQGFSYPTQVPASFRREIFNGRASINMVHGKHTLVFGGEYLDLRTLAHHASSDPRGTFTFNNQYTGNGFADYLLGLVQSARANVPLSDFGMAHSPYSSLYANDNWRIAPNLSLELGVRWDQWWEKALVRGAGATFDVRIGKAVAGENKKGQVDLTSQPVAPFLAAATTGLWAPASKSGIPAGLFEASGYVSPRIGGAWRPFGKDTFVVRAGYGIFTSSYNGNITGSQVIGPPYWASQQVTFAKASNQRWETAFPADPSSFVAPSVSAAVYNIKPMKIHQFNFSIQQVVPALDATVTVSYVASRGHDLVAWPHINVPAPGNYANIQASSPYPAFGNINLYDNYGRDWYNSLQLKVDKRFVKGFSYNVSYVFARDISNVGNDVTAQPTLYAPANYDQGPSPLERRHILNISGIYELPFGRGRKFGGGIPRAADYLLGGWQISGIYTFVAGAPLTFSVPGATLGNGVNARPNIVGDPHVPNPSADLWFNPNAFANPARYQFGNSGVGIMTGPGLATLDSNLTKNFQFTEKKYLQFRWEMFNALNHVNLGLPNTGLATPTTGKILAAGDARQLQFGLKFVF